MTTFKLIIMWKKLHSNLNNLNYEYQVSTSCVAIAFHYGLHCHDATQFESIIIVIIPC